MTPLARWAPAAVLVAGSLATLGLDHGEPRTLRRPLAEVVADTIAGVGGHDVTLSEDERIGAGVDAYLLREFGTSDSLGAAFSVYVGYYGFQMQGRTIHSPKNCLPGAGWEVLGSSEEMLDNRWAVNRYILQRDTQRALVLYWYQGRGRVVANEYRVKFNLLRDAALRRRSDEALVRVVVPIRDDEAAAHATAARVAGAVIPKLALALPS